MAVDEGCCTVIVSYTVGPVLVLGALGVAWVVVHSVTYVTGMSVDILNVVSISVTLATKVSTMIWDRPWMVVEMLTFVTVVMDLVTRLVVQYSYSRMHSVVSFCANVRQTLRSTSLGAVPPVS